MPGWGSTSGGRYEGAKGSGGHVVRDEVGEVTIEFGADCRAATARLFRVLGAAVLAHHFGRFFKGSDFGEVAKGLNR